MAKVSERGQRTVHQRPNRASPSEAGSFVDEYDRLEQDRESRLAQIDADFKQKKRDLNKSVNGDQKAILAEAKKQGVTKAVVRAIANGQKRIRKHTEALQDAKSKAADGIDALETDDRDFAVDIVTALGEDFAGFGLGKAAVDQEQADKPAGPDAAGIAAVLDAADEAMAAKAAAATH